jgi:hypothetical protein
MNVKLLEVSIVILWTASPPLSLPNIFTNPYFPVSETNLNNRTGLWNSIVLSKNTVKVNNTVISWIKIDQLDVTCFIISLFNAQHVSNLSTSILRSSRLICWVISCIVSLWFDVCWWYGVVRRGWGGILMPTEAHRNTNTHRTEAIQPMK